MTLNIDDIHCHAIKKEDNDSYIVTHHDNDESKTHEKLIGIMELKYYL